ERELDVKLLLATYPNGYSTANVPAVNSSILLAFRDGQLIEAYRAGSPPPWEQMPRPAPSLMQLAPFTGGVDALLALTWLYGLARYKFGGERSPRGAEAALL